VVIYPQTKFEIDSTTIARVVYFCSRTVVHCVREEGWGWLGTPHRLILVDFYHNGHCKYFPPEENIKMSVSVQTQNKFRPSVVKSSNLIVFQSEFLSK
jgi:hypothetical protein